MTMHAKDINNQHLFIMWSKQYAGYQIFIRKPMLPIYSWRTNLWVYNRCLI